MKPIARLLATGVIALAALGMIAYKYLDYMKYPWTRDGLVRAQVVQIATRVTGPLVRVPVQNNQLVKKGDLLFEIDPRTFQATVNLARAQLDNMRDIVKSLAERGNEKQRRSPRGRTQAGEVRRRGSCSRRGERADHTRTRQGADKIGVFGPERRR